MSNARGIAVSPVVEEHEELSLLRALFRSSDYGVLFSDTQRQDIVCNPRFAELFGLDPESAVRSPPEDVRAAVLPRMKDPRAFVRLLDQIYADPLLVREDEVELAAPERVLRRYTAPVTDANGAVLGRIWTFLDITPTRRLEHEVKAQAEALAEALRLTSGRLQRTRASLDRARRRLVEAEKLQAVGLLAASVAHDINNILTPLAIELKLADQTMAPERSEALDNARAQMDRLSLLTNRLLALAKAEPSDAAPVDMAGLIRRVLSLMSRQASVEGIRIETRIPSGLPPVVGDACQLEQLLTNLTLNALQAMGPQRKGILQVAAFRRSSNLYVQVSDTGPGVTPGVERRLFEPFFTTRSGGTGLGLYACRRIVEEHGGSLRCRTGPGACFTVRLPVSGIAPTRKTPAPGPPELAQPSPRGETDAR